MIDFEGNEEEALSQLLGQVVEVQGLSFSDFDRLCNIASPITEF